MMAPPTHTVMFADDEPDVRELLRTFLELGGFRVVAEAEDGCEAVQRYVALDPPPMPDVVVLDNRMPGMNGLDVAQRILELHPEQVVVMFSAHLDEQMAARAREMGVAACVPKTQPAKLPSILHRILAA